VRGNGGVLVPGSNAPRSATQRSIHPRPRMLDDLDATDACCSFNPDTDQILAPWRKTNPDVPGKLVAAAAISDTDAWFPLSRCFGLRFCHDGRGQAKIAARESHSAQD